ncbi:MAG: 4-(cytidine 5'-diphospho)-2-C-methyl-D-erythritol kinase [Rhodospirillaceae bacterium]|nr:4-(cytidine 5'-diphospho)-2-C-methyl-D-erythritol kinase [Rhodospirillaceae bacterium]MYH37829.1 4-(cytidine 5'-diphospho)-2-C-methyl-D-erythritol kinase [Rhodospirillaceae bacterium]MYK14987.1 4-(cytidine 5'-diphospho)-2-C-methyl-D-erythritol kinase [Rhodospirillaceae bacterium]MYK59258.1 4-(cytidine 5'-diphospho)-2-C-methyl-D-erythritol kinase [Rhodospirillaceae bacterium]
MPPAVQPGSPLQAFAPAKINLWLHVTGRRHDGYRELDSLVAFADVGDRLSAAPAGDLTLTVSGPFTPALDADNLVLRAARSLAAHCGVSANAALHLEKNLPVAAGIGGGSADAAAALRLCARLWRADIGNTAMARLALDLGADVPACLAGTTARMTGIGEKLAPLDPAPPAAPAVLVNPGTAVSTGRVFEALAGPFGSAAEDRGGDLAARAAANRNDLEVPATALVPEIADVLAALRAAPGLRLARMSGSGATCFGLFAGDAEAAAAARAIAAAHPSWWVAACSIGGRFGG